MLYPFWKWGDNSVNSIPNHLLMLYRLSPPIECAIIRILDRTDLYIVITLDYINECC